MLSPLAPRSRSPVQVGGRYIKKRIHVRVEHVVPSRCREEFLNRRKANDLAKQEAKAKGREYIRGWIVHRMLYVLHVCSTSRIPGFLTGGVWARRGRGRSRSKQGAEGQWLSRSMVRGAANFLDGSGVEGVR